ncbi:ATP-dependent helicase HrpB [Limoniibacter endophyticus]|uniref:ATP-dependent helicase HrpB n=1 Tax=Limoniibacter endophyticus TaxID=1565040 RepID=UPI0016749480|nr:ATP-dependent helicase HrpB [Limoniibacter endophyticus]
MVSLPALPVTAVLGDLTHVLEHKGCAVLVAPPGAGKTTLVPLHLLQQRWRGNGKIIVLEPRRLAARAAARRMASLLGEKVGETVGYAMRLDSRQSAKTGILVVTEGVFARMVLDDPELAGIACVVFDEFHERSLDADFGLALTLDVRGALRPDLRLLVMSATLDGARVAQLLDGAPIIESQGRAYPVEIRYRNRDAATKIEDAMASAIRSVLAEEEGSILAFLPGQREIERCMERLTGNLLPSVDLVPLFGQLDGKSQDAAIQPPPAGRRKVVLATSIAESAITIDGVRIVIDSGLARLPKYEPATGLTRLETLRVSRASADQRAGRAGRTQEGIAIRLWRSELTNSLPAFAPPEILEADLTGLLLDAAAFGITDLSTLSFLDEPPTPALSEARKTLIALGATDAGGRLTEKGKLIRTLALPVGLANMVATATEHGQAGKAARLAVMLTERGLGGTSADIEHRFRRFEMEKGPRAESARALARRIASSLPQSALRTDLSVAALLLLAYPERVARNRGGRGRYVLANGRGAVLDENDALAGSEWLAIADMQGKAQGARITAAAELSEFDVRSLLGHMIERRDEGFYDRERKALRRRTVERLGAIILAERMLPVEKGDEADRALIDVVRQEGIAILPFGQMAQSLLERLTWLHETLGAPWPDMAEKELLATLDDWFLPFLKGDTSLGALSQDQLCNGLRYRVPFEIAQNIDRLAPTHFRAPTGNSLPLRYENGEVVLAVRVQELFGLNNHPTVGATRVPLTLELLSPAHRPLQKTRDLPGFWNGSWMDVRADMRGRYPKHVWPENPAEAQATAKAKPRVK